MVILVYTNVSLPVRVFYIAPPTPRAFLLLYYSRILIFAKIGTSPPAGALQVDGGRMEGNRQRQWNQQHQLALGTTLFVVCSPGRVFVCRCVSHAGAHGGCIGGV